MQALRALKGRTNCHTNIRSLKDFCEKNVCLMNLCEKKCLQSAQRSALCNGTDVQSERLKNSQKEHFPTVQSSVPSLQFPGTSLNCLPDSASACRLGQWPKTRKRVDHLCQVETTSKLKMMRRNDEEKISIVYSISIILFICFSELSCKCSKSV